LTTVGPAVPDGHGGQAHPTETLTYNADGQVLTDENRLSATTRYIYNSFGELVEEILPDPDGSGPLGSPTLHWTYNADGDVASYQDGNGNVYTYTYNDRNQLIQENDPSPDGGHTPGPVWQWQFNAAGELVETIDPMQRVTQYVVDGDANVIQTIAPNLSTGGPGDASTTTSDTYDRDNEKLSETTPNGATTTWQVDDLGRIDHETQPVPQAGESAPVWSYQFDADSEVTQVTNPLNLTQTSTFNGMGQMTNQTSFAGVETAWTYNNLSEILTETVVSLRQR
jgi:YD repeat-containing protein